MAAALLAAVPCFAQTPAPPQIPVPQVSASTTFALAPADVGKVVLFMYEGGKTSLEVTFNKDKQAELAKLAADNANKPIGIMLDGKAFGERTFTGATGHSVKVDMATPEEAFAMAKALLKRDH